MPHHQFLFVLRKYRLHILLFVLFTSLVTIYYNLYVKDNGLAETKFMVNTNQYYNSAAVGLGGIQADPASPDKIDISMVQYRLIYSDEMMNYLVQKFQLYKYFGINEKDEDALLKVRRIIADKMNLLNTGNGILSLTYEDRSSRMAATLLNATTEKLELMNRSFVLDKLYKDISVYNKIIGEAKKEGKEQSDSLKIITDKITELYKSRSGSISNETLVAIQLDLYKAASNLESADKQIVNTKSLYLLTAELVNNDSDPIIKVINKAYPDLSKNILNLLLSVIVVASISFTTAIFCLYYFHTFKDDLKILFGR
jgi:hypothetical protein